MTKPLLSITTPTVRPEALALVARALEDQEFRDFEWLIGSPFDPKIPEARWVKDDFTGGFWSLNRIYNKLIKEARGDVIVSWQDATYATPDALGKFAFYYQNGYQDYLISGVGDKYSDDTWKEAVWKDPRKRIDQGTFYESYFPNIEFNFCAIPKKAFYAVGGFMEDLDEMGFGMDGYCVVERLDEMGGWKFMLDQTNESYSVPHGRSKGWDENNLLPKWADVKTQLRLEGKWPKAPYLV